MSSRILQLMQHNTVSVNALERTAQSIQYLAPRYKGRGRGTMSAHIKVGETAPLYVVRLNPTCRVPRLKQAGPCNWSSRRLFRLLVYCVNGNSYSRRHRIRIKY